MYYISQGGGLRAANVLGPAVGHPGGHAHVPDREGQVPAAAAGRQVRHRQGVRADRRLLQDPLRALRRMGALGTKCLTEK